MRQTGTNQHSSFAYQCCMERHQELPGWLMRALVALAMILLLGIPIGWTQFSQYRGAANRSMEQLRADGQLPPYVMTTPPGASIGP